MTWKGPLKKIDDYRFEIPSYYKGEKNNLDMKTSGLIYTSDEMVSSILKDNAPEQLANTSTLPGIVGRALAMPDIHWGYGFPIGGVVAVDSEEGVISPGGIGFDINCLSGDTYVLHEHGYIKKIKDFENEWIKNRIKCANFGKKIINTKINAFMKFKTKKNIYKILTENDRSIVATEDHPFYTQNGMVKLKNIKKGEQVAVFPFSGLKFTKPSNKLIISEKHISELPVKKNFSQTINELKKRDLLPLRMNNEKLPFLLKLMGYIIGDGTLYFTGNKGTIWFYGEPDDLETIRKDIEKIGFKASKIYARERNHEIKTTYNMVKFRRTEFSIKTTSSSLAALLWAMGTPTGNKCSKEYLLPSWIFDLELWQKRLFLASLFGAELSSPSTITKHGYNFYHPVLSVNKREDIIENGVRFLNQIKAILEDIGVSSSVIKKRKEYVNKYGKVSYRLRLTIKSDIDNLIKLWSEVGFEYNKNRQYLANVAIQYLQLKKKILKNRKQAETIAKEMKKKGSTKLEIYNKLKSKYINFRFIERSIYEKRKTTPRIAHNFPKFNNFLRENTSGLGKSGLVWDKIKKKIPLKSDRYVYDFNVNNTHHNFIANTFVVSNCGVRLVRTNLKFNDLSKEKVRSLVDDMFKNVPSGLGSKSKVKFTYSELKDILERGAKAVIDKGYGWKEDIDFLEDKGCIDFADSSKVSDRAMKRGQTQVGSLGAGNHFLEIQKVADIYDEKTANVFGVKEKDQIMVMIHTGSRGFGHQICSDHLKTLERAVKKYNINVPDRQLACAPIKSSEGENYLKAMGCAANFAWANRQLIVHWVRESFENVLGEKAEEMDMNIVYDLCHNIAKFETHEIDGKKRNVCVHRKGATRSFGPGKKGLPEKYRDVGQPVLIPGDMGTESHLMCGTTEAKESFNSTCHGSGRVMSRNQAVKNWRGEKIVEELKNRGIYIHPASMKVAAEEAPDAYKNIKSIVEVVHNAGLSRKVVKLLPLGVVKG